MIEVKEEGLRLDLVDLADQDYQFVEIYLTDLVDLDVLLEPLLLLVGQQTDADVWQPLTQEHPIFIISPIQGTQHSLNKCSFASAKGNI